MLGKLLKHEFRATGRIMLPLLGALIVLAGAANLSFRGVEVTDNGLVTLILGLIIVAFFLGMFAVCVMAVVIMVQRFYKNLLGDEGYLTLTLPTGLHSLVWSKLIVSAVWMLVTSLVAMTLFIGSITHIIILAEAGFPGWDEILRQFRAAMDEAGIVGSVRMGFYGEMALLTVIGFMAQCLHFYAAMAIGHSFSKDKVLLSVVFYIVIGFGMSLLFSILNLNGAPYNITIVGPVTEMDWSIKLMHRVLRYGILTQLIYSAICYVLTWLPLKKGLNLE